MPARIPMSKMRTLSVQLTQQCNAACEHCGTFSNPTVKVRLTPALAERAIREAAAAGYTDIVFTGGEPTLTGAVLLRAIELTKKLGLQARLVTNGWWGRSCDLAMKRSRNLSDAGLDEINFSTGDQHARFVPLDCIVRCACASVTVGLRVTIVIEIVKTRHISRATLEEHPDIQAVRAAYPDRQLSIYQSPWMPIDPQSVENYPPGMAANVSNLDRRGGCQEVLQTITVSPDGAISACCGIGMRLIPELQLGNVATTSVADASRIAEADPLKWRLRNEGPEHILAWAARIDPGIAWEDMYAHRCQACIRMYTDGRVRKVLREHNEEFAIEHAGDR